MTQCGPAEPLAETAYAKINLALHVRERMPDGYHRIETLFSFCEDGDRLSLSPGGGGETLTIGGPFAKQLDNGADNLVLAAARMMRRFEGLAGRPFPGVALHLEKRLPVAAGLGGGSADAGAAIRLLGRYWDVRADSKELCRLGAGLGADVPACIVSRTRIGMGTGAELAMAGGGDVAGMPVLLVNPGVPLQTGPVFHKWDGIDRGALPEGTVLETALAARNDLEPPAVAMCPVITDLLTVLRGTGPLLARMSGSGATCFALFADDAARDHADAAVAARAPGWWRMPTRLR